MKAWYVRDKWEDYVAVVFAETRGKAHELATHTDCCLDSAWTDIIVRRFPEMDSLYRGTWEMDWDNMTDRVALVSHGWTCGEDMAGEECADCEARSMCSWYERNKDWMEESAENG